MSEANNPDPDAADEHRHDHDHDTSDLPDDPIDVTLTVGDVFESVDHTRLSEETVDAWVRLEADLEANSALKARARDRVDEAALPDATQILWIDEGEAYLLCDDCYASKQDRAWTGTTEHPHFEDLVAKLNAQLDDGTACQQCRTTIRSSGSSGTSTDGPTTASRSAVRRPQTPSRSNSRSPALTR